MYTLLITFFLIAIVVSFLCSLWEAVLLSITPSYAQIKLKDNEPIGVHLQSFKENIDRPLAAILTLNTIAHTVGAIGVGNQAARIWADSDPLITGLVVPVVMTLGILVLSELIPKTIGANSWQELAPFTVKSLLVAIALLAPLIWFSQFVTKALKKDKSKSVFSRMDFMAMAQIGADHGVFEEHESHIIGNLLSFNTIQAKDVMTPRTVMVAASQDMSIQDFFDEKSPLRFSRIPIYESDNPDRVTGYFLKDDMLAELVISNGAANLASLRRNIMVIKESYPIPDLFNGFLEKREHIALVVDDFGGVAGLVTMEDVIETLLGMEIIDESDKASDMQALARKQWRERAKRLGLIEEATAKPASDDQTEPGTNSESAS